MNQRSFIGDSSRTWICQFRKIHIILTPLCAGMTILDGYKSFFEAEDDPNLAASKKKDGMFFIFRSIEAWKEENCKEEDIPAKELVLNEFKKNRFIAHP